MDFYVYALLDSRKPGRYQYEDYIFDFEPFYIGKGFGNRINSHTKKNSLKHHTRKNTKIKKLIKEGKEIISVKVIQNLSEKNSYFMENRIIKLIGRIDLGNGPLTNHNDGGEGGMRNLDPSIKKKLSDLYSIPLTQINLENGEKIGTFRSGREALKKLKVKGNNIRNMNWAYGFGWINSSESNTENISLLLKRYKKVQDNKKIGRTKFWEGKNLPEKMKNNISNSHKKKVAQVDPNTEKIIRIYNSIKEAKEKVGGNIGAACLGKRKTAAKYKWKFI